jgi:hypothetical protein
MQTLSMASIPFFFNSLLLSPWPRILAGVGSGNERPALKADTDLGCPLTDSYGAKPFGEKSEIVIKGDFDDCLWTK